jgi:acyl-CoA synthetase (AMP-forming)/AMP-acid ligase II
MSAARVVLLNYLLPRDVLKAIEREKVTGLTAVPPLYIQLTQLTWPETITEHLRYFANTGGRMPRETLDGVAQASAEVQTLLMYGLTEAFRSTYLPPEEVDRGPTRSARPSRMPRFWSCARMARPVRPMSPANWSIAGRWSAWATGTIRKKPPSATSRYRSTRPVARLGLVLPEIAVFSGDTVRMDEEGFLYFIGRRDEMMKTSGYRVSPTEVEEILYATKMVGECVAFGVDDDRLGQAIQVIVTAPADGELDTAALLA